MAKTLTHDELVFILLITGGRDFNDADMFRECITRTVQRYGVTHQIDGDAAGADRGARTVAISLGVQPVIVPAMWDYYKSQAEKTGRGNPAGPIRNQNMARLKPDLCLAFPGGAGTKNMIEQCHRYGIKVVSAQKLYDAVTVSTKQLKKIVKGKQR